MKVETTEILNKIVQLNFKKDASVSSLFHKNIVFIKSLKDLNTPENIAFLIVNDLTPELHYIPNNDAFAIRKFVDANFNFFNRVKRRYNNWFKKVPFTSREFYSTDYSKNSNIKKKIVSKDNKINALTINNEIISIDSSMLNR